MVFSTETKIEDFDTEISPVWIAKAEYPFLGKIDNVTPIKGKFRTDYRLTLTSPYGIRHFDVWGKNLAFLQYHCGANTASWRTKTIQISLNELGHRVITAFDI